MAGARFLANAVPALTIAQHLQMPLAG